MQVCQFLPLISPFIIHSICFCHQLSLFLFLSLSFQCPLLPLVSSLSCLVILCLHAQPSCCKSDTMVEQLTVCRYVSFSSFYFSVSPLYFFSPLFLSPPPLFILFSPSQLFFFISSHPVSVYPFTIYCSVSLLMICFPILISAAQPSNLYKADTMMEQLTGCRCIIFSLSYIPFILVSSPVLSYLCFCPPPYFSLLSLPQPLSSLPFLSTYDFYFS